MWLYVNKLCPEVELWMCWHYGIIGKISSRGEGNVKLQGISFLRKTMKIQCRFETSEVIMLKYKFYVTSIACLLFYLSFQKAF